MIYKVHKANLSKQPFKDLLGRPIVSCVNSLPSVFGNYVSHILKKLVENSVPSYLHDSTNLRTKLKICFPNGLPPGAKLFSLDAIGMHGNIDTDHGICVIKQWF